MKYAGFVYMFIFVYRLYIVYIYIDKYPSTHPPHMGMFIFPRLQVGDILANIEVYFVIGWPWSMCSSFFPSFSMVFPWFFHVFRGSSFHVPWFFPTCRVKRERFTWRGRLPLSHPLGLIEELFVMGLLGMILIFGEWLWDSNESILMIYYL